LKWNVALTFWDLWLFCWNARDNPFVFSMCHCVTTSVTLDLQTNNELWLTKTKYDSMIESIYRYKTMHKIYPIFTNTHAEKQIKFLTLQYTKHKSKFLNSITTLTKMCLLIKLHNMQKSPLQNHHNNNKKFNLLHSFLLL